MIIINGKTVNPPTKKGDKYRHFDSSSLSGSSVTYTAKHFIASSSEGEFDTLWECQQKYPDAERYYVVNEEYDGWSDIKKAYKEEAESNIVITNISGSNITIKFS